MLLGKDAGGLSALTIARARLPPRGGAAGAMEIWPRGVI